MDGCMLLNKSQFHTDSVKTATEERKRKAVLFGGARTLTLTQCRKTEEFTNETSDRCLQELSLLCC